MGLVIMGWADDRAKKSPCHFTRLDLLTGKLELDKIVLGVGKNGDGGCGGTRSNLGDYIVHKDHWTNKKTLEKTICSLPYGPCELGAVVAKDAALFFEMAQRKSRYVTAIASGTADFTLTNEPGWNRLQKFGQATSVEPTRIDDWPTFRGSSAMGNSIKATLGDKPVKAWEVQVGLGGKSFGMMSGQRLGLTQPVVAYGLAVLSDIEGQRIVACNVADGKTKWVFHVGSRVDYSPTLYN